MGFTKQNQNKIMKRYKILFLTKQNETKQKICCFYCFVFRETKKSCEMENLTRFYGNCHNFTSHFSGTIWGRVLADYGKTLPDLPQWKYMYHGLKSILGMWIPVQFDLWKTYGSLQSIFYWIRSIWWAYKIGIFCRCWSWIVVLPGSVLSSLHFS
jgi:hypothetical protein